MPAYLQLTALSEHQAVWTILLLRLMIENSSSLQRGAERLNHD